MNLGIANVAVITALVYIIGMFVKTSPLDNKWIPSICGILGIGLGIVAFVVGTPDFPATDIVTAAAVGGISGLAATGINQIVKQLSLTDNKNAEDSDEDTK
jgi:uncharacterized membrane protein HdeD (DUF308 family)